MGKGSSSEVWELPVSPEDSVPWDHTWVYANEMTHGDYEISSGGRLAMPKRPTV